MNTTQVLENIGLGKNEIKVYYALLDLGQSTTTPLIKKTGINSSKVYENLERLLKKGIVSYTIIRNKKHWRAEPLISLQQHLDDQKKELDNKRRALNLVLPQLKKRINRRKEDSEFSIFEGIAGIKAAREKVFDVLQKGDTFFVILSSYPNDQKMEGYWMDFQRKRAKKGIHCKYIFGNSFRKLAKKRLALPLTTGKYVDSTLLSPTWMEIYGDYVAIGVLGSLPSVFVIENSDVAKSFRMHFDLLWKIGRK